MHKHKATLDARRSFMRHGLLLLRLLLLLLFLVSWLVG